MKWQQVKKVLTAPIGGKPLTTGSLLIAKVEDRSCFYVGDNTWGISATLNIYLNGKVVASTGISASYDITQNDFSDEVTRQLKIQANKFTAKILKGDTRRANIFPTTNDFDGMVTIICDVIQTKAQENIT